MPSLTMMALIMNQAVKRRAAKPASNRFCGTPRKTNSARKRHLLAEVTLQEKKAILDYCQAHNLSVSSFLAKLALDDARSTRKTASFDTLTITINLPANRHAKLLYLARLREQSIDDLINDFIEPNLAKTHRGPGSLYTLQTETLRYYLSDEEHALIKNHMQNQHVSSRHYLAQLAIQTIARQSLRRKNRP